MRFFGIVNMLISIGPNTTYSQCFTLDLVDLSSPKMPIYVTYKAHYYATTQHIYIKRN